MAYKTIVEDNIDILVAGAGLGGTGFYRWTNRELIEQATAMEMEQAGSSASFLEEHLGMYRQPPQYMAGSNEVAELLLERNLQVCPKCDYHMRIGARRRIEVFLDPDSAQELGAKIAAYREARAEAGHEGPGSVALMLHTFVGPDDAAIRESVPALLAGMRVAFFSSVSPAISAAPPP